MIVHAYEQWGTDAIARLRGMFALALWDARSRQLLLARDRIGIKPLHYAVVNGRLYFGSEIKSILEAPDVPRDLDLDALNHYLSFLYTPRDESIFRGIRKLPPGHLLTCTRGRVHVERYWRQPTCETFRGSEAEAVSELHGILVDAVRSHLVSDVPLGAFLSGGVDSSLVVGLMAETSRRARQDVFDRVRRTLVRRARARTAGGAPLRDRSSRVCREAGRGRDSRFADRAFRRTVRRFVGHPDVVRLGEGERARHGRALRGRRRRAVRGLRSLPSAPSGRRLRSLRPRHRPEGRGDRRELTCRTAPSARISFGTWRGTPVVGTSTPSGFTAPMKNLRCWRPTSWLS